MSVSWITELETPVRLDNEDYEQFELEVFNVVNAMPNKQDISQISRPLLRTGLFSYDWLTSMKTQILYIVNGVEENNRFTVNGGFDNWYHDREAIKSEEDELNITSLFRYIRDYGVDEDENKLTYHTIYTNADKAANSNILEFDLYRITDSIEYNVNGTATIRVSTGIDMFGCNYEIGIPISDASSYFSGDEFIKITNWSGYNGYYTVNRADETHIFITLSNKDAISIPINVKIIKILDFEQFPLDIQINDIFEYGSKKIRCSMITFSNGVYRITFNSSFDGQSATEDFISANTEFHVFCGGFASVSSPTGFLEATQLVTVNHIFELREMCNLLRYVEIIMPAWTEDIDYSDDVFPYVQHRTGGRKYTYSPNSEDNKDETFDLMDKHSMYCGGSNERTTSNYPCESPPVYTYDKHDWSESKSEYCFPVYYLPQHDLNVTLAELVISFSCWGGVAFYWNDIGYIDVSVRIEVGDIHSSVETYSSGNAEDHMDEIVIMDSSKYGMAANKKNSIVTGSLEITSTTQQTDTLNVVCPNPAKGTHERYAEWTKFEFNPHINPYNHDVLRWNQHLRFTF